MKGALGRHGGRIAITLLPVLLALLHAVGMLHVPWIERLDGILYDTRMRATLPGTRDERIVIIDIDDASLQQQGQWPWSRDKLARLTTEIMGRQQAAVLGFDVLFAEADERQGLSALRRLVHDEWRDRPAFAAELERLVSTLDPDQSFAQALAGQRVALGYYFTRTADARAIGVLPPPVLSLGAIPDSAEGPWRWNGYGASLPALAQAASAAGFINAVIHTRDDGVIRATPLLARYEAPGGVAHGAGGVPGEDAAVSGYYESLALAVYRLSVGAPAVRARLVQGGGGRAALLGAVALGEGTARVTVPVDPQGGVLVPFRGPGGPSGGSFRYIPAARVLAGALSPAELRGKIVLVGATAPGLQDLRATPVSATYPGVEVHANVISGILDGRTLHAPDYAVGYDVVLLLAAGGVLAFGLSLWPARRALALALGTALVLVGLNTALYLGAQLVLPLAAALLMILAAFVLNMSWGYLVEERDRRRLTQLFGSYVPPQLVDEMLTLRGHRFSMRAESRELTVMFCDMRGFTRLSEQMTPAELQRFLNTVFSRLTDIINAHRGTVDKYIGDCVMAFWGAPVDVPDHAAQAVQAAIEMVAAVRQLNQAHRVAGLPEIHVGIGLNTGLMSVGDMGSTVRRSYTVVGDAVNLAARLEGLSDPYGVDIVVSGSTRAQVPDQLWQELDRVRVKGRSQVVSIFTPVRDAGPKVIVRERLARWADMLAAYRAQDWRRAQALLAPLRAQNAHKVLYRLYDDRLALAVLQPQDTDWDGATQFEIK